MAHFPTNTLLDTWIASTVRSLLRYNADQAVIGRIFGNQVIPHVLQQGLNYPERTYAEAFYGDFHHPSPEFVPYTTQLMQQLPLDFLLRHLNGDGSYRSWMDLRALARRPDLTHDILHDLDILANQPTDGMPLEQALEHPGRAAVDELLRLRF